MPPPPPQHLQKKNKQMNQKFKIIQKSIHPYIIGLKESKVSQASEPDQQVAKPKEQGADVPRVQEALITL